MSLNAHSPDCPSCGAWITKVVHTKLDDDCEQIIRRRHCEYCDHRFYSAQTIERVVEVKWKASYKSGSVPRITKSYDRIHRKKAA